MLSTLLYVLSLGVVGLVSYLYLKPLLDDAGKSDAGSTKGKDAAPDATTATTTATGTGTKQGKPSRANLAGRGPIAAATATPTPGAPVSASPSPPPPLPPRNEAQAAQLLKDRADADAAAPPSLSAAKETPEQTAARLARTQERAAREAAEASAKAARQAQMLSGALATVAPPPPKRPMLNILHAPTLTESIAFSSSPRPEAGASSATPSSSSAAGGAAAAASAPVSAANEKASSEHRKQVLWEFVSSEEKYIHSLNVLMNVYYTPLKAKAAKGSDKITTAEHALLFSNLEAIWRFHQLMLPALKTAPEGNVASVIQTHADYLKMYTKYVADYSPALNTVHKLLRNDAFSRFLRKARDNPQSEGLDLMSYLIMPVQRVPRYSLLLRELSKHTPSTHPHYGSIQSALAKVSSIASFINETQRAQENASLLLEFQMAIHSLPEELTLFEPHRKLVRHGILKVVKQEATATTGTQAPKLAEEVARGDNFRVILFNDTILYATLGWDYRGSLKLQGATLNSSELRLELVREKTPSFRLQQSLRVECPSAEEAAKWQASFRESIASANELGMQDEKRRAFHSGSVTH